MTTRAKALCGALLACAAIGCEPPAPSVAPRTAALQVRKLLPWDTAVGRIVGDESSSEGPMSFALAPGGGLLVLDQVNRRILDLDAGGNVAATIPLPASTFEDVELFEGWAVLALDRLVGKVLRVMDRDGALLRELPLEGSGIERAGAITALLPRPDGVWLEVEHRHSVRVLDARLRPCERQVVLGRPIANGRTLRGELDGDGGVRLSIGRRTEREPAQTVTLVGEAPIERIPWLDADAGGHVHAVLHEVRRAATTPFRVESERYLMVVLDEGLDELSRSESTWVTTEIEQNVEFRVGRDGRLWQMAFTPDGVLLLDWGRRQP
jgi:hypothetical protein